jgi:hypothetical protein
MLKLDKKFARKFTSWYNSNRLQPSLAIICRLTWES